MNENYLSCAYRKLSRFHEPVENTVHLDLVDIGFQRLLATTRTCRPALRRGRQSYARAEHSSSVDEGIRSQGWCLHF